MRIRSIATVFVYLMVVGLCILAAGYAGSAYTIYFEGVIGVCLAMIFVCISEGIVGFCLNDRYSIEAQGRSSKSSIVDIVDSNFAGCIQGCTQSIDGSAWCLDYCF